MVEDLVQRCQLASDETRLCVSTGSPPTGFRLVQLLFEFREHVAKLGIARY